MKIQYRNFTNKEPNLSEWVDSFVDSLDETPQSFVVQYEMDLSKYVISKTCSEVLKGGRSISICVDDSGNYIALVEPLSEFFLVEKGQYVIENTDDDVYRKSEVVRVTATQIVVTSTVYYKGGSNVIENKYRRKNGNEIDPYNGFKRHYNSILVGDEAIKKYQAYQTKLVTKNRKTKIAKHLHQLSDEQTQAIFYLMKDWGAFEQSE